LSCASAYLDQQQWVQLLRADSTSRIAAAARVQAAVAADLLAVPLSAGHYSETWHRGRWQSRWQLAELMWTTSRLLTIAPLHALLDREVAQALLQLGLNVVEPPDPGVFGFGVNHAMASPTGRLTLVESVSPDGQHGREMQLEELSEAEGRLYRAGERGYEWFSLAGLPADMTLEELDLATHRRAGAEFAEYEMDLARRSVGLTGAARRLALVAQSSESFWSRFDRLLKGASIDPVAVYSELFGRGQQVLLDLILSLPCYGLLHELRVRRHANLANRWQANDRIDLLALAVSAVHCDTVVTERHWAHELTQVGRTRPIRATATSRVDEALDWLAL
jgi:hypothetical protein